MRDAGIGRLLVASLHQGIADRLPDRLEFYENWLNPRGLRDGTIGLAPLHAVLSFLRTEGDDYARVTTTAGEYAGAVGGQRIAVAETLGRDPTARAAATPRRARRRPDAGDARVHRQPHASGAAQEARQPRDQELDLLRRARPRAQSPSASSTPPRSPACCSELGIPAQTRIVACQATGDGSCRVEIDMSGVVEEHA